jgi:hypothetical protein
VECAFGTGTANGTAPVKFLSVIYQAGPCTIADISLGVVATEYAAKKGACMKRRVWWPQALLTGFAVISLTLGLSVGAATASVAKPASTTTAAAVTKIHAVKCTKTTLSINYDKKKVACYTGEGYLKVALPDATKVIAGSTGGILFLRENKRVNRDEIFFPHERLLLAGQPEVDGIILYYSSVKAGTGEDSTLPSGTVAFTVNVVGSNVALTAASSAEAALINAAIAAQLRPMGGGCHSFGWRVWKDYCEWTFTHNQSENLIKAAAAGGKAAVVAVCSGLLHKFLGELAAAVCTFLATLHGVIKEKKLEKDECIAAKVYLVPPHGSVSVVKC